LYEPKLSVPVNEVGSSEFLFLKETPEFRIVLDCGSNLQNESLNNYPTYYPRSNQDVNKWGKRSEKMGLRREDKQIANENSDFDTLLKDGNMNLDKLIADVTKSKNKSLQMIKASEVNVVRGDGKPVLGLDENRTGWMLDDVANADWSIIGPHFCPSILSGQMSLFYASNKRYHVPWSDVEKVYIPLSNLKTHWALAELEL
ncbi:hypothetical protein Tco_1487321, partial [Tanacetum coccineum]